MVGGGGLAVAAHSIAESLAVPYVYAAFAPITLPSPHHAPPVFGMLGQTDDAGPVDIEKLWADDRQRWNALWKAPLNAQREQLGLARIEDVRFHLFTARPWLAADAVLAPWPGSPDLDVLQTGAWLLEDTRPLGPELEAFLDAGEPQIYCGFGSVRAPEGIAQMVINAARGAGRRTVIPRVWADLALIDNQPDCISIGEVNQQALFPQVAAVAHHGGAGTTKASARAGVPQGIIPQMFDQYYFADRVQQLGIGTALTGVQTTDNLRRALEHALSAESTATAHSVGARIKTEGARVAAQRLVEIAD